MEDHIIHLIDDLKSAFGLNTLEEFEEFLLLGGTLTLELDGFHIPIPILVENHLGNGGRIPQSTHIDM